MSDDASLTDFSGGRDGTGGAEASEDGPDAVANAEAAEEPTFTYTSTPDGTECEACGDVVGERWHAGDGGTAENPALSPSALVCPDCKEW